MAGHFCLSRDARNFSLESVERMSALDVVKHFAIVRWGSFVTPACPECGTYAQHYFLRTRNVWRCRELACGRQFSVTTNTVFADHKLPLKKILTAITLYQAQDAALTATSLHRLIGVAYQTAFVLLHKIREGIHRSHDRTPLNGMVHIDGAHFGGRPRKPNVRRNKNARPQRARVPRNAYPLHQNRRIVMVLRQAYPDKGRGAERSIVAIARAENPAWVTPMANEYVERGSVVWTDESNAFAQLAVTFDHDTVNHAQCFSEKDGVNNNQAESFFSRCRRLNAAVRRLTPTYLYDYMSEIAWREDNRRMSARDKVNDLLAMALKAGKSVWWRGYWQKKGRRAERLYSGPGAPTGP